MPAQPIRRMPISCENCRQRKIRCHGSQVPCDTCIRRGRASTCHFLKDDGSMASQATNPSDPTNLMDRISQLEQLLKQQIALSTTMLAREDERKAPVSAGVFTPGSEHSYFTSENQILGRLVTDSHGYVRYIPSTITSGPDVDLLDRIYPHGTSTVASSEVGHNPFLPDGIGSRQQLLDLLPPLTLCDALKTVFLDLFSPIFHVLHDPSFNTQYQNFRQSPEDTPLSVLALIFTVIAIATTALSENDPLLTDLGHDANTSAKVRRLSAKYQSAALRCLAMDNFLWRHSLATLQSLILLIYSFSHTRGPAWSLLGTTFNIAVAIGCHIDPSQLEGLSLVESEERRRCWAAVMMLYTIQNTCLGNVAPMTITASVQLPADIEDDDLTQENYSATIVSEQRPPSKMAYILHKFRLYQLASEICQLSGPAAVPGSSRVMALHDHLVDRENQQLTRFSNLPDLPIYHQAHFHILGIYTNHLFLILHRPCLKTRPSEAYSMMQYSDDPGMLKGLEQCIRSATKILQSYDTLTTEPQFASHRWYTVGLGSFYALLAASSLIVAASDPRVAHKEHSDDVIPLLHRCLQSFKNAAGRSEICASGFRFLTGVLQTAAVSSPARPGFAGSETSAPTANSSGSMAASFSSPSTAGESSRTGTYQHQKHGGWETMDCQPSFGGNPGQVVSAYSDLDLDGWTPPQKLVDLVSGGANQQWLAPSSFAWDSWLPGDVFSTDGASMPPGIPSGMQLV